MHNDLKYALRSLLKSPGFTAVALLTIALGVAAVAAIHAVADAVVFRPLPYKDEAGLYWVWSTRPDRDRAFFSIANFLDHQRETKTTAGFAPVTPLGLSLTGQGDPERVNGWRVAADFFAVTGVVPHLGRTPTKTEDATAPTALLGYGYWQRRFGGDPTAVGRALTLNGAQHVVVGILPPDFVLPAWNSDVLVSQSIETDPRRANRGTHFLRGVARLAPGVTRAEAQAEFAETNARLVKAHPAENATLTPPRFVPLREEIGGSYRVSVLFLLAAAGALLLIMCANLAGLIGARGLARQRDAALHTALAATRGRLFRRYLAEGLVLAIVGGTLAILLCVWLLPSLLSLAPADLPRAEIVSVNPRVIALALSCAFLTACGASILPAWRLARTNAQEVLKSGSGAVTVRHHSRLLLVGAQTALCTALLIGTGLFARSLREVLHLDPGFDPRGVVTAQAAVVGPPTRTVAAFNQLLDDYLRRVAAVPGVQSAGVSSVLPLSGINTRSEFSRPDKPPADPTKLSSAANRYISAGYLATVGIPLLSGRDFTDHDRADTRGAVIIDAALAARDWPGENPLGRTLVIRDGPSPRELEIIGVVGNAKNFSLEETGTPTLYLAVRQMPAAQLAFLTGRMTFAAKTAQDPLAFKDTLRAEMRALDPNVALTVRTLDEATAWARAPRIFNLRLLSCFALAALGLAMLGLYATMAQSVAARTRELGIRLALGARAAQLRRDILVRIARVAGAGITAGCIVALLCAPLISRLLYGVRAYDLPTYSAVAVLVALTALASGLLPARRAAKVDPMVALRSE